MGKIVKYCAACEESFAEKFAFCPNCGKAMEAFEMNPLIDAAKSAVEVAPITSAAKIEPVVGNNTALVTNDNTFAQISEPEVPETFSNFEPAMAADTTTFTNAGETKAFTNAADLEDDDVELEIFDEPKTEEFEDSAINAAADEPETFAATAATAAANGNGNYYQTKNQPNNINHPPLPNKKITADDGFHVTVIQEKNGRQRNGLLLGALVLMLALTAGGMVYSIFNHPLLVGAIGDDQLLTLVPLVDDVPMQVEEQPKPKADKDSGGGGGGGREEETPTSRGRLAPQMPDPPLITPTKTIPQKDFELKMQATTVGNKQVKPSDENYGDPNAKYGLNPSDGMGKGGGQGSGSGTGQGSGKGLGQGSGNGSGSGGGDGDGNGNGTDSGNYAKSAPPAPPAKPVGVTEKIKFISKPKASYTDQARTNQIQGTVRLRITFSASGQVGSIAPVSGLPYGLTEQAIAAARQIRFEPAKRNGVPIPTTAVVEYNFNIY